jgi:hypothetical protein
MRRSNAGANALEMVGETAWNHSRDLSISEESSESPDPTRLDLRPVLAWRGEGNGTTKASADVVPDGLKLGARMDLDWRRCRSAPERRNRNSKTSEAGRRSVCRASFFVDGTRRKHVSRLSAHERCNFFETSGEVAATELRPFNRVHRRVGSRPFCLSLES